MYGIRQRDFEKSETWKKKEAPTSCSIDWCLLWAIYLSVEKDVKDAILDPGHEQERHCLWKKETSSFFQIT